MADVTDADVPKGQEVRWYGGGVFTQIQHTVTSGDVSATGFALGGTYVAEYGSIWIEVNGTPTAVIEYDTSASTPATEDDGTDFIGYSGITEADVVDIYFIDIGTTLLTHVASAKDVKNSNKASSSKEAVHGQSTKIITVGAVESTATLAKLSYTIPFVAMCFGDSVSGSPAAGDTKWSNKTHGFKTIGALVGKRYSAAGVLLQKWFLINALPNTFDQDFPTEGLYKESFSFDCGYIQRVIFA